MSHSKRRTRRIFKPNLHRVKIVAGKVSKRMKLCTKCIRKLKNQNATRSASLGQEIKSESKKLERGEAKQFNDQIIQPVAISN